MPYTPVFTPKNATFSSRWTAEYIGFVWAGDLNLDGKWDLIVPGASYPFGQSGNVGQIGMVLLGDGVGGFSPAPNSFFPNSGLVTVHPRQILVEDLNGDGRPDIFIASHGFDTAPFPGEQNRLYLSQPNGSLRDATSTLPQILDFTHSAAIGDINGDGWPDIFVGNIHGQREVEPYILLNDGTGHFSKNTTLIPSQSGQSLHLHNGSFTSSLLVDLNEDGKPELVVGSGASGLPGQSPSAVYWKTGIGFDDSHRTRLPEGFLNTTNRITLSIAALDIDRDGAVDLVTLSTSNTPYYEGTYLDVFINRGSGNFENATSEVIGPKASIPGGGWSVSLSVVDIDQDGFADLALPEYSGKGASTESVFLLLNDGRGHLQPVTVAELTKAPDYYTTYNAHLMRTDSGYGFISLYSIGSTLSGNELLASGARPPIRGTEADDTLAGSSEADIVFGYGGRDRIDGRGGNDSIDGGAGIDAAVYSGRSSNYAINSNAGVITVVDQHGDEGKDTLVNVERLSLSGSTIAFDVSGNAGQAYRLYQAAFHRTPDTEGLSFWVNQLDQGASLSSAAANFITSNEFKAAFGNPASLSNAAFLDVLYTNILGRAPEASGKAFWQGQLDQGLARAAVLASFSESPENMKIVGAAIQNGITLDPHYLT